MPLPSNKLFRSANRRHARQSLRGVETPYGVVLDVSDSGACLFHKGSNNLQVDQSIRVRFDHAGFKLDVPARVVRIQEVGLRRFEVGVEFLELTDAQRHGLRQLADAASAEFSTRVWLAA